MITYCALVEEVRFFPTGGRLPFDSGLAFNRSASGYYWASTLISEEQGWRLYFTTSAVMAASYYRTEGYSIRCVAQ